MLKNHRCFFQVSKFSRPRKSDEHKLLPIFCIMTHRFFISLNFISPLSCRYSVLTFLPLNLFEQFRKIVNIYFLGILILQFVPGLSPLNPITSLVPLLFVLAVSAIKVRQDRREGAGDINEGLGVGNEKRTLCELEESSLTSFLNCFGFFFFVHLLFAR